MSLVIWGYLLISIFFLSPVWSSGVPPQEVVLKYYQALKNKDFARAYQYISRGMRAGKSQAEWTRNIQDLFDKGKVEIGEISVSGGQISGQEAQINSTITSKDRFNVNGLIEYNREYLVLEDDTWKLDRTELQDSKPLGPTSEE